MWWWNEGCVTKTQRNRTDDSSHPKLTSSEGTIDIEMSTCLISTVFKIMNSNSIDYSFCHYNFQNCHHSWAIVVRHLSVFLANTIPQTAPVKAPECLELWTWVLGIICNDGANIKDRRHNTHPCFVLLYFDTGSSFQAQAGLGLSLHSLSRQ